MKGIQKNEGNDWEWVNSLMGLNDEDAKKEIAQLRRWAREDKDTNTKYRIREVVITC